MVNGWLRCLPYMLKGDDNQQKRGHLYKDKVYGKVNSLSSNNSRVSSLKKPLKAVTKYDIDVDLLKYFKYYNKTMKIR